MPRLIEFLAPLMWGVIASSAYAQSTPEVPAAEQSEPDFHSEMGWRIRDGWGLWRTTTEFEVAVDLDRPIDDERFERLYRVTRRAPGLPDVEITSDQCPAVWAVLQSAIDLTADLKVIVPAIREAEGSARLAASAQAPLYDLWLNVQFGNEPRARMKLTSNVGPLANWVQRAEQMLEPCLDASPSSH